MTRAARTCDATETAALLDFGELVTAIERAAVEKEGGAIACPERQVVPLADDATLLSMPAVAADLAIHKLITVAPGNRARGLPTIQGAMTVLDPLTGRSLLILDGPTVTGRRTAAVSMCALKRLAPADARAVLLIGTGAQAGHHVAALAASLPDCSIRIRGTSPGQVETFCEAMRPLVGRGVDLAPARADERPAIVITCSTSATPVWLEPARAGTLIVAVGSFRPAIAEIAGATVRGSTIFVDDLDGARHEAGDLIVAGVDWNRVGTLAALVSQPVVTTGPVLFKSVGCAAWDLAAGRLAWSRAQRA